MHQPPFLPTKTRQNTHLQHATRFPNLYLSLTLKNTRALVPTKKKNKKAPVFRKTNAIKIKQINVART